METTENNATPQNMNEARKPQKSLKERCKEMGAIPLKQFEKEFWDAFEAGIGNMVNISPSVRTKF